MRRAALRIGTRASALALWQAEHVAALIRAQPAPRRWSWCTSRPKATCAPTCRCGQAGGRAFFTSEIDRAQLAGTKSTSPCIG